MSVNYFLLLVSKGELWGAELISLIRNKKAVIINDLLLLRKCQQGLGQLKFCPLT